MALNSIQFMVLIEHEIGLNLQEIINISNQVISKLNEIGCQISFCCNNEIADLFPNINSVYECFQVMAVLDDVNDYILVAKEEEDPPQKYNNSYYMEFLQRFPT